MTCIDNRLIICKEDGSTWCWGADVNQEDKKQEALKTTLQTGFLSKQCGAASGKGRWCDRYANVFQTLSMPYWPAGMWKSSQEEKMANQGSSGKITHY